MSFIKNTNKLLKKENSQSETINLEEKRKATLFGFFDADAVPKNRLTGFQIGIGIESEIEKNRIIIG